MRGGKTGLSALSLNLTRALGNIPRHIREPSQPHSIASFSPLGILPTYRSAAKP